MTFFNSKEEVIEIQLTPYGKYKLSKGDFTPISYAFFDDNILYNAELSAGESIHEIQNSSEPRIQEQTPSLKTQCTFRSVDFRDNEHFYDNNNPLIETKYGLLNDLGNCKLSSDMGPAWDIKFYKGEMIPGKTIAYLTGSTPQTQAEVDAGETRPLEHALLRIPQIEAEAMYKTYILDINNISPNFLAELELPSHISGITFSALQEGNIPTVTSRIFNDGSFFRVKEDYFIIDVNELNVDFKVSNFDVELYRFEETENPDGEKTTELIPLTFLKKIVSIKDDLLLDESIVNYEYEITDQASEYYFEVSVDHEITRQEICEAVGDLKSAGYLVDSPVHCEEDARGKFYDIYNYTTIGDKECPD